MGAQLIDEVFNDIATMIGMDKTESVQTASLGIGRVAG